MRAFIFIALAAGWLLSAAALSRAEEPNINKAAVVESRRPQTQAELRRWLENMIWAHGYSLEEVQAATGLDAAEVAAAQKAFNIFPENRPTRGKGDRLLVLPYPGGRYPRIGFLEGAQNPQRETDAMSVVAPRRELFLFLGTVG